MKFNLDKKSIVVFFVILFLFSIVSLSKYPPNNFVFSSNPPSFLNAEGCLHEKYAEYSIDKEGLLKIVIFDEKKDELLKEIKIYDVITNHYHPVELRFCSAYVLRRFGYDNKTKKFSDNYRRELWKISYNGTGGEVVMSDNARLSTNSVLGDFRIDPNEKYLVLLRGYIGKEDYALIIKDLKTLEDVFVFPITELERINSDAVSDIRLDGWSSDGRYFWANTHDGAPRLAFIRIDREDWSVDVFPVPKDILGGDALNYDKGLITIHPGNEWSGDAEIEQEEKARRRSLGQGTELYIQNLETGSRTFVTSTPEPLYYFQPRWISNTELEYTTPSGEKGLFTLP